MKITIESEKFEETVNLVGAVERLKLSEKVISVFEHACYEDENGADIPCVICGGFGHNQGCKWFETLQYVKNRLGIIK